MKNEKRDELSIVLPVFNEKEVIERVIQETHAYASRLAQDLEIIAVDDGSTDGTDETLRRLSHSLPDLKVISHPKNAGYGGALISGIKAAEKTWILLLDSDGQMGIGSLQAAWPLRNEYDLLLGYREKRADSFYRRVLGRMGNIISNMLLGRHVKDINCGFKLFRKEVIKPLGLTSTGGIINFEILWLAFKNNPSLKWHQFLVTHYPRKAGRSTGGNPKVIYRIICEGAKICLNIRH